MATKTPRLTGTQQRMLDVLAHYSRKDEDDPIYFETRDKQEQRTLDILAGRGLCVTWADAMEDGRVWAALPFRPEAREFGMADIPELNDAIREIERMYRADLISQSTHDQAVAELMERCAEARA